MPTKPASRTQPENQLLARLPLDDYRRLSPHLQAITLPFKKVLYSAHAPIDYAYFPKRGVLSALRIMKDGRAIEVATIGNEGAVGLMAFVGAEISTNEVIVQIEGEGLRMRAATLKEEASRDGAFRRLLLLYHSAYLTQVSYSVACNGLHTVQQRCCRWILMSQDRMGTKVIHLTHELLAIMLGVRRSSVTDVLHPLQKRGLISSERGRITIIDRPGLEARSCECFVSIKDEFRRLLG